MSCLFYVIMVKRSDGKVYADLHKAGRTFYLTRKDAEFMLKNDRANPQFYHVVELIASLPGELK
jgi:hypothetical protein